MSTSIKIVTDTVLKQIAAPSASLSDDQKVSFKAGTELKCNWAKFAGSHLAVSLVNAQKGKHNWYAFAAHVRVLEDGKPITLCLITKEQAEKVLQNHLSDALYKDLLLCLTAFDITTAARIKAFLSQVGHESGGLIYAEELASGRAYEGRLDLGNTQPGDGVKYKGGGFIQLTGRSNYQAFSDFIGDPKIIKQGCPYVANKYPFTSAGFWWKQNNANLLVDKGASVADVTRLVNGGLNGYEDRLAYYNRALQVLG